MAIYHSLPIMYSSIFKFMTTSKYSYILVTIDFTCLLCKDKDIQSFEINWLMGDLNPSSSKNSTH
jgi:hypothetical protein